MKGLKIGGRNVNNIRYADDNVLEADSEEKLQKLVEALYRACVARGLHINLGKKAEDMSVNVKIKRRSTTQVQKYKYLVVVVTDDGKYRTEVLKRIGMEKTSFNGIRKVLTNMNLSRKIRLRVLKCFICSVLMYGREAWTLEKTLKRRLEAVEMWFLRRTPRLPCTARVTNERVMEIARVKR